MEIIRRSFLKISILSVGFGLSLLGISHLYKKSKDLSSEKYFKDLSSEKYFKDLSSEKYFKDLSSGKFTVINGYFVTNEELKFLKYNKVIK